MKKHIMDILERFFPTKRPIDYGPQILSEKQLFLVEQFDAHLLQLHSTSILENTSMKIKSIEIPIQYQYFDQDRLLNLLTKDIKKSQGYIPRSVALIVDADGTWIFLYAIRETIGSTKPTTQMFIELLNKTNNARK